MAVISSTELGASGRYIYFNQAAFDDLGSQTILAYCRPTGSGGGTFAYIYGKVPSGGVNGPRMFIADNLGQPKLTFGASSTGSASNPLREGAADSAIYDSWGHYACTWDGSLNYTGIHSYAGVGANLAEIGYGTQNNGTTAVASDASNNAYLMNRDGLGREFVGDVAYVAVWDRVLSLSELQNAQNNGPLSESTGLVLLWANQADLGPNSLTETGRSTYAAGAIPPNTALGGSVAVDLAGDATATASATAELASNSVNLSGDAAATATATADVSVTSSIAVAADFERSSINAALSSVSGSGDDAIITLRPRVQESEVVSSQTRWLHPLAKITGVNGIRPTFRFNRYRADVDGGYHYTAWDAGRKPMFSYDLETWFYFDTTTINNTGNIDTGYIEFRDNQVFTSDTVYVSKGRVRTVSQAGAWIDAIEAAYPSLIHNAPSNTSGFSSGTFSAQTDELGAAIPAQPFYAFKISDASLVPASGIKGTIALVSGVHAGEDQGNWVLESAVEFLLSSDLKAQNVRQHFDVFVYPMLNAPGRAGGGWRGSFTQGAGGIDDANRHFSDASPNLEIITIPRAAMQTDMPGAVHVAVDFHGALHDDYSIYIDTGNPYQPLFDAALETYMGSGNVADEGESHAGFVSEWFRNVKYADFGVTSETGDPATLTDGQLQTWGEAHIKAISDLLDNGDIIVFTALEGAAAANASAAGALSVAVPLAGASVSTATAGGALSISLPIAGDASATANASGGLSLSIPLSAVAAALAAAAGAVSINVSLSGAAIAEAAGVAGLTVINGSSLAAAAQAQASASGALSIGIPLAGTALTVSSADGSLTQIVPLTGSAASASMATGGMDLSVQLDGAALAQALAAAGLSVEPGGLSGSAIAEAAAGGTLTLRANLDGAAVAQAIAAGALTTAGLIVSGTPGWTVDQPARNWSVTS